MNRTHAWMACRILALLGAGPAVGAEPAPYLVVDLSGGVLATHTPVTELAAPPPGGWSDEHRSQKLVLRYIPPGTFVMGSPAGELGRPRNRADEDPHTVTLTKGFYLGIFEVTQGQWYRVIGNWPSYFRDVNTRESRPVEQVSYDLIRKDDRWPTTNTVHEAFFMGRLRARTGLMFDLPTGAQWEYACRAGAASALNSGKELTGEEGCMNLSEVGRFLYNAAEEYTRDSGLEAGTARVGSFAPNAWGLYDMHGNVWEWVLDWATDQHRPIGSLRDPPQIDPRGEAHAPPGHPGRDGRIVRGGSWATSAAYTRCASMASHRPEIATPKIGFRVAVPADGWAASRKE